jgi:hypothetical protein
MSGVLNNVGITFYGDQRPPIEGTAGKDLKSRGYANPLLAQISTWTFTLSDTVGDVTVTIRLPDGTELSATGTDAGLTDTTHAATIVLAINTDDAWANIATATNVAGVITVVYLHAGLNYPFVSFSTPGAGVLTPTSPETQAAGGAAFPVGRWCVAAANASDPSIPALASAAGAAAANLIGITIRPSGQLTNTGNSDNTVNVSEAFPASDMVPVGYDGPIYVTNVGSVASVAHGPVHAVVNTAGGQLAGQSRADADGGNTVIAPNAYWLTPTAVNARGMVYLRS